MMGSPSFAATMVRQSSLSVTMWIFSTVCASSHGLTWKGATSPTSKAPLSAVFHSFRPILGRAIVSRSGLDAETHSLARARAAHSR